MAEKSRGKIGLVTLLLGATALFAGSSGLAKYARAAETNNYSINSINGSETLAYVADSVGNQDGITEALERDYTEMKLEKSDDLYIVTQGPFGGFAPWEPGMSKIYASEKELRDHYKGIGIRGQVGILKFNRKGDITGAYSSSGYISDNEWTAEKAPKLNIKKTMADRFDASIDEACSKPIKK